VHSWDSDSEYVYRFIELILSNNIKHDTRKQPYTQPQMDAGCKIKSGLKLDK